MNLRYYYASNIVQRADTIAQVWQNIVTIKRTDRQRYPKWSVIIFRPVWAANNSYQRHSTRKKGLRTLFEPPKKLRNSNVTEVVWISENHGGINKTIRNWNDAKLWSAQEITLNMTPWGTWYKLTAFNRNIITESRTVNSSQVLDQRIRRRLHLGQKTEQLRTRSNHRLQKRRISAVRFRGFPLLS